MLQDFTTRANQQQQKRPSSTIVQTEPSLRFLYNIKPTQRPNEEEIRTPARISLGYNHLASPSAVKHCTLQTLRSQDRDLGRPLRRLRDPQRKDTMVQVRRDVLRVDRAREPDGTRERRTAGADEVVASRDLLVSISGFVGDGVRVCACA